METQKRFDFTVRGGQLQLLERARLPFPGTRMAVLRAIDDVIGQAAEWVISIDRLIVAGGWSRSTVTRAIGDLVRADIIDVTDRYRKHPDGGVERLPGLFRIVWSNLADFVPEVAAEPEPGPSAVLIERRRCDRSRCTGGGSGQADSGVGSECGGGRVSLTRGSGQSDPDPVQTPVPSVPSPSGNQEGKDLQTDGPDLWRSVCDSPARLRSAVKSSDPVVIGGLWAAAAASGWVPDVPEVRRRFLAACYYVTNPPDGFPVDNAGRLLRWKCERNDWTTGNGDGSDDDWAAVMSRRLDGLDRLPRSSAAEPRADCYAEAGRQLRLLRERAVV